MLLSCHTCFSLRYGTLSPEGLVWHGKQLGIETLVLTDINNTSAHFDFIRACKKENIKPIVGIEFRSKENKLLFTGIAKNNKGLYNLNVLLTKCSLEEKEIPDFPEEMEDVYVIYPLGKRKPEDLLANEFIAIKWYEVPKMYGSAIKEYSHKYVAFHPVTFLDKEGYHVHQLLQSIDQNTLLSKLDTQYMAHKSERLVNPGLLMEKFRDYPNLVFNAQRLLDACGINLDLDSPKNKKHFTSSKKDDTQLLKKLAYDGFEYRYSKKDKKALARLKKELEIIETLNFTAYFLISEDIIRYATHRGYHHIGRGSGANSIVAYCLKITDVDPIELDLYFERFINPYRLSPPDFDLDFSWDERDDVTDYIFKRYGKDHVALLATYSTFQRRAIIRELGKVYGLPKNDIDTIADYPNLMEKHHPIAKDIYQYSSYLQDFPNHLSIHAGGVLITEEPLCQYTALQLMPKGFPITHFDMHVAEDNGFYKYDILSQRGLGHIKEAVKHILKNKQISIDIHRVSDFKKDPVINQQLSSAKTIGCFYIESPAMRGLITKLKCNNFLVLVAASSVIRPGVAKSGMMREFINRHHHPDEVKYIHETFKEHLGETYGVMVYQEDVIKIAHHFGGLDLGQADVLRRIMSGKSRGVNMEALQTEYQNNCKAMGHSQELADEVWRQIESFAGYSFCKAHSASFAVESYQSLFLKTYYPLEFMVGVINNFGGFYNTELYVHEARRSGAIIEAPCVNNGVYLTNIKGNTIHLGFIHLKGFEQGAAQTIVEEREKNGFYQSLQDFMERTFIKNEQLLILIRIGALRFTHKSKQELMWAKSQFKTSGIALQVSGLFKEEEKDISLPSLEVDVLDDVYDQMDLLGFPLTSPFDYLNGIPGGIVLTKNLHQNMGKSIKMIGYYVCEKLLSTVNRMPMAFGTWLDQEGEFFDTVHFPTSLQQYPFLGKGCYLIEGKVVEDFSFPSLEVVRMEKIGIKDLYFK